MASSGDFDLTQIYDGYKAAEVLDPACTECLAKGKECFEPYNPRSSKCHYCFVGKKPCHQTGKKASNVMRYLWMTGSRQRDVARWTDVGGPIYSSSEIPISRIKNEGIVKGIRRISDTPPGPDAEPPDKKFQIQVIPSTPRNLQPTLATTPASPHSSHTRPALNPAVRPSPIQQSRNSPMINSQQLQHMASTSRRREELSPFPFPAAKVFQHRDQWPIQVMREDPNMESDNQDSVTR
ncbi:hypothetical protein O181_087047 [Austropuccinia psidii MF-1]|uniref:Uncharacterized protein n=1 Tax=Austropuccinia psidii MF-1 TaxID=1389203 RepID=A0A9Q3INX8_9BASI|nr:hypothetical protein [Austropuccinia psidii MF-1]